MVDVAELSIKVSSNADSEAAALDRLAQAAGRTESAAQKLKREMDAASRSARQARANTVNLAQQFQDVFVSIQGGQAPLTAAMQQGVQFGMILGNQGAAGAAKALATPSAGLSGSRSRPARIRGCGGRRGRFPSR